MTRLTFILVSLTFILSNGLQAQQSIQIDPFDKVIVSPYISVSFVEGPEERVTIESCTVDPSKLFVEVKGQTLRIYLEGAKETPKWNNYSPKEYDSYEPLYRGTVVKAIVTYKNLSDVSLRGDSEQLFKGLLSTGDFRLKIYGNSKVIFEDVDIEDCHATLYGENSLVIKSGKINSQQYTVYGTSTIDCKEISNRNSKLTTYGEADYYLYASNEIKLTLFGEANLYYKGNPIISRGLNFGDVKLEKLD